MEQVQNATSTTTQRQPGVVDTEAIDSPGKFDEEPMKRADPLFKLRSNLGAVGHRNELELTTTEESSTLTETQHDAQHADVPHTRDDEDTVQVSQCRWERGIRREEAVRDGMGAKVCCTPEERVVLQTQRRHTDTATSG